MSEPVLHQINHFPEQMTAGDVVTPANMLAFEEYETPEQAVRDIIRWFLDRDTVLVERCEHGRIDGHYTRDGYEPRGWCEGAGIGD